MGLLTSIFFVCFRNPVKLKLYISENSTAAGTEIPYETTNMPLSKKNSKKFLKSSKKRSSAKGGSNYNTLMYLAAVAVVVGTLFYVGFRLMSLLLMLILVVGGFAFMYPESFALWSADLQAKFGAKEQEPYHPLADMFDFM